jgi:hypothetical protein
LLRDRRWTSNRVKALNRFLSFDDPERGECASTRHKTMRTMDVRCGANLRCGVAFDCCGSDDAVTVIPDDAISGSISSALSLATGLNTTATTLRAGWVDGPQVLDRFHAEPCSEDFTMSTTPRPESRG